MGSGSFASFGTWSVVNSFAPSRIGTIASVRSNCGAFLSCAKCWNGEDQQGGTRERERDKAHGGSRGVKG